MSLAQVLAELDMCSHVSAASLEPTARDSGEEQGGKRPPGGVDGREDHHREPGPRTPERLLRSADYYRRQLAKGGPRDRIEEEAVLSLEAWRIIPRWAKGQPEPEPGSVRWRRMIADSPDDAKELARRYQISARTVHRYRREYGEQPAA